MLQRFFRMESKVENTLKSNKTNTICTIHQLSIPMIFYVGDMLFEFEKILMNLYGFATWMYSTDTMGTK